MHFQIRESVRMVTYTVEFGDPKNCPGIKTNETMETHVSIETADTGLDVMIAAADKYSDFNFKSTYFGNTGFSIESIAGTAI